ncbi:glycosyltransferase family 2 protein [Candidatus Peregrinibacteria bacterium]|jgi:GT2 family glycosyltransferase|nr:glycosyltransferase family 2 protein [Candidatus Peregrinibacteria bacterium]
MAEHVPKLSIIVITHNEKGFLKECLSSLQNLAYKNYEIVMIDQDSKDGSVELVEKNFPEVRIIRNQNTGYCGGSNKGFYETKGEYIAIVNPDTTYEKDYFDTLIKVLESDPKIGAITGKILKATQDSDSQPIIDTTGLLAFRNRRVVDRGQGVSDEGQFEKREEVFGVSGCIALYRRAALKDIELPTFKSSKKKTKNSRYEVWDSDFFMYKEDIDISWRLNLRGWKCVYEPGAIAYHKRGTAVLKRYTNKEVMKHRSHISPFAKKLSYKNQRLMQVKNETPLDILKSLPIIIWKEILTLGYIVLREPTTLISLFKFLRALPRALKKRHHIQKTRQINSMTRFFSNMPK